MPPADIFAKTDRPELIELLKEIRAEIEERTYKDTQGDRICAYVGGIAFCKKSWEKLNNTIDKLV